MRNIYKPNGSLNVNATNALAALLNALRLGWDADTKGADLALSNDDLTAMTTQQTNWANARSILSHSSGKRTFRVQITLAHPASDGEMCIGLVPATWDVGNPVVEMSMMAGASVAVQPVGDVVDETSSNAYTTWAGAPCVTGDWISVLADFGTGEGWVKKNGVLLSGDPEAGTGAHFHFNPGALFAALSCYSADPPNPVGALFDGDTPDGSFDAWNA